MAAMEKVNMPETGKGIGQSNKAKVNVQEPVSGVSDKNEIDKETACKAPVDKALSSDKAANSGKVANFGKVANIDEDIDRNKYVFDLVNHWIESADSKVSISYAVFAVLVTAITMFSGILDANAGTKPAQNQCLLSLSTLAAIIGYILFLISVILHSLTIKPRLPGKKKKKNADNAGYSIFYEDIKDFSNAEEYIKSAMNVTKEEFNGSLLSEIYYNSKVASQKMAFHGWGQIAAMFAIAFLVAGMILKLVA